MEFSWSWPFYWAIIFEEDETKQKESGAGPFLNAMQKPLIMTKSMTKTFKSSPKLFYLINPPMFFISETPSVPEKEIWFFGWISFIYIKYLQNLDAYIPPTEYWIKLIGPAKIDLVYKH